MTQPPQSNSDRDAFGPPVTVEKPPYTTFVPLVQADATHPPVVAAAREVRALWISRFDLGSPPLRRDRLEAVIHQAADAGFNTVLLQVRATGDAYYKPGVEPWSYRLTSSRVSDLGRDPGWDPLAVAIATAHSRGIELHAYLNAFTLWECNRGAPPHTTPEHPYWKLANYNAQTKHYDPSWRVYGKVNGVPTPMGDNKTDPVPPAEYIWASAGVERVHLQTLAVIKDIAARYAIDGIHLDRIRYPGKQYSHDPQSYAAWQRAKPPLSLDNWQRDNLSRWIARYRAELKAIRPNATLSAAVWFTYKKTAAMKFATSQGFYDYYQDSHRWLADGSIDAIAPMIYGKTFNEDVGKWKVLADAAVAAQRGSREIEEDRTAVYGAVEAAPARSLRQVWLGLGADLPTFDQMAERIDYARKIGACGVSVWSAGSLNTRSYWDELKAGPFRERARPR